MPKVRGKPPDPSNPGIQIYVLFGDLEIQRSEILRQILANQNKSSYTRDQRYHLQEDRAIGYGLWALFIFE